MFELFDTFTLFVMFVMFVKVVTFGNISTSTHLPLVYQTFNLPYILQPCDPRIHLYGDLLHLDCHTAHSHLNFDCSHLLPAVPLPSVNGLFQARGSLLRLSDDMSPHSLPKIRQLRNQKAATSLPTN